MKIQFKPGQETTIYGDEIREGDKIRTTTDYSPNPDPHTEQWGIVTKLRTWTYTPSSFIDQGPQDPETEIRFVLVYSDGFESPQRSAPFTNWYRKLNRVSNFTNHIHLGSF